MLNAQRCRIALRASRAASTARIVAARARHHYIDNARCCA